MHPPEQEPSHVVSQSKTTFLAETVEIGSSVRAIIPMMGNAFLAASLKNSLLFLSSFCIVMLLLIINNFLDDEEIFFINNFLDDEEIFFAMPDC